MDSCLPHEVQRFCGHVQSHLSRIWQDLVCSRCPINTNWTKRCGYKTPAFKNIEKKILKMVRFINNMIMLSILSQSIKNSVFWTSLGIQWLKLSVSTAEGTVSILHAMWHRKKKKVYSKILMEEVHKEGKERN